MVNVILVVVLREVHGVDVLQDVGVVVEAGGYSDEVEDDGQHQQQPGVDDEDLRLVESALPGDHPAQSRPLEAGRQGGQVEVAARVEQPGRRVEEHRGVLLLPRRAVVAVLCCCNGHTLVKNSNILAGKPHISPKFGATFMFIIHELNHKSNFR